MNCIGLVSAKRAEHCGFVHLYAKLGLAVEAVPVSDSCPCVAARVQISGKVSFDIATVHMMPGPGNKASRIQQFKDVIAGLNSTGPCVILGDMNVRHDEVEELPVRECSWRT